MAVAVDGSDARGHGRGPRAASAEEDRGCCAATTSRATWTRASSSCVRFMPARPPAGWPLPPRGRAPGRPRPGRLHRPAEGRRPLRRRARQRLREVRRADDARRAQAPLPRQGLVGARARARPRSCRSRSARRWASLSGKLGRSPRRATSRPRSGSAGRGRARGDGGGDRVRGDVARRPAARRGRRRRLELRRRDRRRGARLRAAWRSARRCAGRSTRCPRASA